MALLATLVWASPRGYAADQPVAIFHAFNQKYHDIEGYVCKLADQGYSHLQISPAQKSNPGPVNPNPNATVNTWAGRYQPEIGRAHV